MNKRFLAISLLVLSCSGWQTRAQQASIGSGTSSSLTPSASGSNAGIGNIFSPNLYNGTANVSVPIYGYGTDNGEFGVSLSYNTGGVKVSEKSGPVGLHWSLNAGGRINRVLKDMPDEMNTWDGVHTGGGDCEEAQFCQGVRGRFAVYNGASSVVEMFRHIDGESDDFVVSVGSLNFTFNIGAGGFVFTHPHRNVKVELLVDDIVTTHIPLRAGRTNINNNITFRIRDEQGVQYFFESKIIDSKGYVSMTNPDAEVFSVPYISQWDIQKVILANGDEILYNYAEGVGSSGAPLYMAFQSAVDNNTHISYDEVRPGDTKKLTSIQYPNNVLVSFIYDNTVPRCDNPKGPYPFTYNITGDLVREIKVAEFGNCLRYQMQHAYSVAPGNDPNTSTEIAWGDPCAAMGDTSYAYHRVILKGIRKASCDSQSVEPYYTFEYDTQRLPWRYSGAQDYFGYYNGQVVTEYKGMLTIPFHDSYGTVKDHNAAYITAGILRTVKNAYGGEVHFNYEGHNLNNVISGLPVTAQYFMGVNANDGVRVKDITIKDRHYPGSFLKQEFSYSGGQRFLTGGFFHTPYYDSNSRIFHGIYVSPHQLVNGSNHGYSQVIVTSKDQAGNQFSRSLTEYTNFYDPVAGQPRYELNGGSKHYYELPFADRQYIRDWELGLPIKQESYDEGNRIVSRTVNEYNFTLDKLSTVGKVENEKRIWYTNTGDTVTSETYRPYTGRAFLNKTTSYKFIDNTNYVKDVVTYQYDGNDNLKSTLTTNSKGEQFLSRNVYNYEVSGPGVAGGNQTGSALYAMTVAGIEKQVSIETWKLGGGTVPFNNLLLQASITGFTYDGQKIRTKRLHMLDAGVPVTYSEYTGIVQGSTTLLNPFSKIISAYEPIGTVPDFELVSEVQSFDVKGNPKETWLPKQDAYKSMIWDEVTGKKLAEANCRYSDMAYGGFETTTKGNWNYDEGKVVASNLIPVGAISGKRALKLASTDNSGLSKSGLTPGKEYMVSFWTYNGVPKIVYNGATVIPLELTYALGGSWSYYQGRFVAGSAGTLAFVQTGSGSPFHYYLDDVRVLPYDAQMQSWNYEDMTGVSSVADANGRITYFEYDKLGRQVLVRDQQRNIISKTEYHIGQ